MQGTTDFVKWLTKEHFQDVSNRKNRKIYVSSPNTYYQERSLVEAPARRTRTFMEYTPLEIQKIIDLVG